jgi:endonuclease III-like uncharacterized protein
VDAYTRRILERHRMVSSAASYDEIRLLFEQALGETPPPKRSMDGAPAAANPPQSQAAPEKAPLATGPRDSSHPPSAVSEEARSPLVQVLNEMHGLIVGIGKTYCLKSRTRCDECPLREFLPTSMIRPDVSE